MFESKAKINMWVECGDDYYFGRDGEKVDYEMAAIFYYKAMKKKHPRATYMLGLCHELGRGVDRDMEYAEILYEKAAEYGDTDAKKRLAGEEISEYAPRLTQYFQKEEAGNVGFWIRYAAEQRDIGRLLQKLSLPIQDKAFTREELEQALKEKRRNGLSDNNDYAALTLALLAVKARLGGGALFDGEIVRVYLTDLLPGVGEMRRLSALVFNTDAIGFLRSDPQKAFEKLKARGMSDDEAERLMECFVSAFAVTVDYSNLPNDSLLAAAGCSDSEAIYVLATRYYEDGDEERYHEYLQKAVDLGHGPAAALLEMPMLSSDESE